MEITRSARPPLCLGMLCKIFRKAIGSTVSGVSNQERAGSACHPVQPVSPRRTTVAILERANRLEQTDAGRGTRTIKSILGSGLDRATVAQKKQEAPEPFWTSSLSPPLLFLGKASPFRPLGGLRLSSGNCDSSVASLMAPFGSGNFERISSGLS